MASVLSIITSQNGKYSWNVFRYHLILLPLAALYLAISFTMSSPTFVGDESSYVEYASQMVHGTSALPRDFRLWWGPGYPFVLVPFIVLRLPWIAAKSLNAAFLFGAILYFHELMRRYIVGTSALAITIALGLYPPFMREAPHLMTESLVFLLICSFMFHFCALYNSARRFRLHLAAASLSLGYLALTKVFFGYVLIAVLVLVGGFTALATNACVAKRNPGFPARTHWCVPYLFCTFTH